MYICVIYQVAFVLPILNSLLRNPSKINGKSNRCDPLAIIVVPRKKRVKQIYNVILQLSSGTSIKCGYLSGIASTPNQKEKIMVKVIIILFY